MPLNNKPNDPPFVLAIHGGAGTIRRQDLTPDQEAALLAGLHAALDAGQAILAQRGSALDAVIAAVSALEDNPLFNAGRGAVFNDEGRIELEAAVMNGPDQAAGSVTGVTRTRNPVQLARAVMQHTAHVTLGFDAADRLALTLGLPQGDADYFYTAKRWQALQDELARMAAGGSEADAPEDRKHGTVGAVALDCMGRLAAATSTGGRTAKMAGRIGDTPVIGAGTWADTRCAVSGTGHGEYFVRAAVAHDIAARIHYGAQPLAQASQATIDTLTAMGGTGGVIAIDHHGNIAMPFNCEGMYRAAIDQQGQRTVAIYRDGSAPATA
ncbi:beta-aspartyl-peptidase (threonine type) [Chitinivorax tropicus]|uniref:Isoaspartyl peptidase n=1 Tax=Chitinivorax tropicus TaxID=714531 RepID=A0A840MJ69_9PROT|nr:isoaspartyl peptidase/L-asparaginase [Chitinivorax tropicus]MBB5016837.1 beta-aspartyl-peptidase (threonine type) [Chitinivorax tropicus]